MSTVCSVAFPTSSHKPPGGLHVQTGPTSNAMAVRAMLWLALLYMTECRHLPAVDAHTYRPSSVSSRPYPCAHSCQSPSKRAVPFLTPQPRSGASSSAFWSDRNLESWFRLHLFEAECLFTRLWLPRPFSALGHCLFPCAEVPPGVCRKCTLLPRNATPRANHFTSRNLGGVDVPPWGRVAACK